MAARPERRPVDLSGGHTPETSIGIRTAARAAVLDAPAPAPAPEQRAEPKPAPAPALAVVPDAPAPAVVEQPALPVRTEAAPAPVKPAAPKPAARKPRPAPADVGETAAAWDALDLPALAAPRVSFDADKLLSGPARGTTLHLPRTVDEALAQIQFDLKADGVAVTRGTLVAHALAYAYAHHGDWLDLVPADGRRSGADTNLSLTGRRTNFALTQGLRDAPALLLRKAAAKAGDHAPARVTLEATALAWGLSQRSEWIEAAKARPVARSGD